MNSRKVNQAAAQWSAMAMADFGQRLRALLRKEGISVHEFGIKYGIPAPQLAFMLKADPASVDLEEPSLSTIVKVVVMSGLAIEIKPVSETPIGSYDLSDEETFEPRFPNNFRHRPAPGRPAAAPQRPSAPKTERSQSGWMDFEDSDEEEPDFEGMIPPEEPEEPGDFTFEEPKADDAPRFGDMSRNELVDIIEKHLWDSEIDVEEASRSELVKFLEQKNEMLRKFKKGKEESISPKRLKELQDGLCNAIKRNPDLAKHLAPYIN